MEWSYAYDVASAYVSRNKQLQRVTAAQALALAIAPALRVTAMARRIAPIMMSRRVRWYPNSSFSARSWSASPMSTKVRPLDPRECPYAGNLHGIETRAKVHRWQQVPFHSLLNLLGEDMTDSGRAIPRAT